jgi:bifunctional enzyme CysN/CysC
MPDLLRLLTCGSVDDGKSTLIGRLLYDTQLILDDQLAALERDSARYGAAGENIDFALLVDGLEAEREQSITIDVAWRFFTTARRRFIVADTPGHEQYTRNMATGASNAELAVVLVDARNGVLSQTRRHSFIAALMGIHHVVLAVNKIDLVGFDQARFEAIRDDYLSAVAGLGFRPKREHAVVHRLRPARLSRNGGRSRGRGRKTVPYAGAVGEPARPGFPRLRRYRRRRAGARGRCGHGGAIRGGQHGRAHRHHGRRP